MTFVLKESYQEVVSENTILLNDFNVQSVKEKKKEHPYKFRYKLSQRHETYINQRRLLSTSI